MTDSPDDRSPTAKAIEQASQVTTIALMMVVPAIPGYVLDSYLKTLPVFTIIGLLLGMAASLWQLIKFINRQNKMSDAENERQEN